MTTYRKIHGRSIQAVTTDPTESVAEGQVWYNTTSDTFKTVLTQEAWVASNKMNTPRATMAGGGIRTSAILSGKHGANPSDAALAESYNGTGWTSLTNVPTALGYASGTGSDSEEYVQVGGGYPSKTTDVYDWDGSSWTSGTAIPTATIEAGVCGPAASAFLFGGNNGLSTSYERSGGSWTSGGTMAAGVYAPSAIGTQTAAISMGGVKYPGGYQNDNQSYDGTSWTALTDLPANRGYAGGAGVQTLAMVIAGEGPPTYSSNLEWNGSSWTTLASLAVARNTLAKGATTTNTAIAPPGNQTPATTEEYNRSSSVITAAAWASSGSMNTARAYIYGCGLQDAALVVAGYNGSVSNDVEEYNGSTWSEQTNMGTSRYNNATLGIQTAAFAVGGRTPPPDSGSTTVENYDGSSWTSAPSLNSARTYLLGVGTTSASLVAMGANPRSVASNLAEEYDGSSWSAVNTNSTTRRTGSAGGIQTAATYFGGTPSPTATEEYDGTNWTAGGALGSGGYFRGVTTNSPGYSVMGYGGGPGNSAVTEGYDGTSWSTRPSMGTARHALAGAGIETAALAAGGRTPSYTGATEEFTGETTAVNVKTLTQS